MSRFDCNDCVKYCNDCVKFGTEACTFGIRHKDYSLYCDDILVEENHAYNKAIDDIRTELIESDLTTFSQVIDFLSEKSEQLKG